MSGSRNPHSDAFSRLRAFTGHGSSRSDHPRQGGRRDGSPAISPGKASGSLPTFDAGSGAHASNRNSQTAITLGTGSALNQGATDFCELCSLALGPAHRHLFEMPTRQVVCACDGCALRFHDVIDGRYKLVPRDPRAFGGAQIEADQWRRLALPIDLAFFVWDSQVERIQGYYPSPGGLTESQLPLDAWEADGMLDDLEADVEALLVNRTEEGSESFVVPIDMCYELAGLLRVHWRGFTGGRDVQREMEAFFDRLRNRTNRR